MYPSRMENDTRLEQIYNLVSDHMASGKDMLVSTARLLSEVIKIAEDKQDMEDTQSTQQEPTAQVLTISCDASIKVNPGGPASVGFVIRKPDDNKPVSMAKFSPGKSNNEAEYDAIYEGLMFVKTMMAGNTLPILVLSDSQLVIKQITGKYKINLPVLQRKADSINELAKEFPVDVKFEWRPRNSTPDLTEANFIAQDKLGVRRH